jgi:AcrR family transcriptional regulator
VPKVTEEHLTARRRQILDGARRAFAEHGYDGATVARLEEATGLSRGAIFHYFENKTDLFVELVMDTSRRLSGVLFERGPDEALRAIAGESPEWIGVLIEAESKLRHDPEFVRRYEQSSEPQSGEIREWFAERQRAGSVRDDLPSDELARFTTSVMNGLALRVASAEPFDVEAMIRLLNDALAPRA